eukprot:COSAG01_NODE_394_length_17660_cov_5.141954_8_plen_150_part_00
MSLTGAAHAGKPHLRAAVPCHHIGRAAAQHVAHLRVVAHVHLVEGLVVFDPEVERGVARPRSRAGIGAGIPRSHPREVAQPSSDAPVAVLIAAMTSVPILLLILPAGLTILLVDQGVGPLGGDALAALAREAHAPAAVLDHERRPVRAP